MADAPRQDIRLGVARVRDHCPVGTSAYPHSVRRGLQVQPGDVLSAVRRDRAPVGVGRRHAGAERIASRTTNPFGKDPVERARILDDLATVEPILRRTATAEIDTSVPLLDVVLRLESLGER